MSLVLDNKTARRLVLHLQGLTRPPHRAVGTDGLLQLIEQLGFVQMDSIPWMERAHHMILFARCQAYRPRHLRHLHEREAALFENWTHDASLIPSSFWPYWQHKFDRERDALRQRFTRWQGRGFEDHAETLLDRIRTAGRIRARDLEKPSGKKQEMWQWHEGKAALEYLWRTGNLAIPARESGFQKTYDLCERVIPDEHYRREVDRNTFIDWACRTALDRLGMGSAGDIARFWDLLAIDEVRQWLEEGSSGQTRLVVVEPVRGEKPRELHARPDIAGLIETLPTPPDRIRLLSPFDPVIRDRKRLKWLFGFDYTIEIYVPPEKRKFGYYVFPMLERDRLIGRIDCQARRKDSTLFVKRVWLEKGVRWSATRQAKLESELVRQARLCSVNQIAWDEAAMIS